MAGDAADADDAGLGGCFRQWPGVQRMLIMLDFWQSPVVAGGAADAHDACLRWFVAVAGGAAGADFAGFGGCFWQWPSVQLMLMMLASEGAFGSGAADARDVGVGGWFRHWAAYKYKRSPTSSSFLNMSWLVPEGPNSMLGPSRQAIA